MAYGEFILDLHPEKLTIKVGGGVNEESIKRVLRRASYHRRTLVRENPRAWAVFLVREVCKLSKYVEIGDNQAFFLRTGYQVTIARTRDKLHLRILDLDKLYSKEIREPVIFDGSFFAFCGNSEQYRTPNTISNKGKGGRLRRQGRLDWFREQYKKKHGYYPHEETPDSPKRYDPLQEKLNKQHKKRVKKVRRIKEAAASRKKRKALIKKLGVSFGKVNRRDYFETPPENVGSDD